MRKTVAVFAVLGGIVIGMSGAAIAAHRSFVNGYPAGAARARESAAALKPTKVMRAAPARPTFRLKKVENFNGKTLDTKLWQRIGEGKVDWNRNMSLREDLVSVKDGILTLRGILNDGKDPKDTRRVLTGGVMTKDRFVLLYGKIEFRMKLQDHQKGAWPAVWMMPQKDVRGWPNDGEIDIVERLNGDDFVYQTAHYGDGGTRDLTHGGRGKIKRGEWNIYALEWTPDEIVWYVNGTRTHAVKRQGDDPLKYPWTTPFYLMFDMQLGGKWVGGVEEKTLPVEMYVDWVKFYELTGFGR